MNQTCKKKKEIKEVLKLLETFLNDGRSFCFQAQAQCDYFNIALSPQPGAVRKNTQYYHSASLSDLIMKIRYMIEVSKDPNDKRIVITSPEIEEEDEDCMEDLL